MKRAWRVVLWGVVVTGGIGAPRAVAASDSPKVAVLNLSVVFDGYQLTKDLEVKFDEQRKLMALDAEKRRGELDLKRQALEGFKSGTADHKARRDELTQLEMQYQVWAGVKEQQLRDSHKEWLLKVYQNVRAAVEAVAKEQAIDLVLTFEEVTDQAPDSKALRQQLLLEKVIWFSEKLDLTKKVIDKVNQGYAGRESIQIGAAALHPRGMGRADAPRAEAKP